MNLDFIDDSLGHLKESIETDDGYDDQLSQLRYNKVGDEWWCVTRDHFDLVMMDQPYQSLAFFINTLTSKYILRVLGSSRYKR